MAMTRADLVQRYFDDELEPEARRNFEATMTSPELDELAELAELRGLLRICWSEKPAASVE
jgi:hypothetical protein